ncbi:MAG TPA: peptide-methionine (S)-S-oxide reductase [Anaerolineaceae bacterium]|jgi:peptide-methionine (S)-S-oxide reductase|nr:peptide-methionine (S)-S-oxide reductase [Anaerolineaceae bacterium]
MTNNNKNEIVLAGGCFWGMEELFRQQPGVLDTDAGYTGGENDHPTYQRHPGHAEALKIVFDPTQTDLPHLLDFFFRMHDSTTLDRQGNDIGASYRSAIFFRDEEQKNAAEEMIKLVDASGQWKKPVVTTLEKLTTFWKAEDYHQDYLQKLPNGYTCHFIRKMSSFLKD